MQNDAWYAYAKMEEKKNYLSKDFIKVIVNIIIENFIE